MAEVRECIFCGSSDELTREHIWSDWVRKLVPSDKPEMHFHRFGPIGSEQERSYPKRPYRWRLRVVCKTCNNGWMSRIDDAAKPIAEPMILGHGKALHE